VFSGTEDSMRERALQLDSIGAVRMQSSGTATAASSPSKPASPAAAGTSGTAPLPAAAALAPAPAPAATTAAAAPSATPVLSGTGSSAPAPVGARAMLPYLNSARGVAGLPPVVLPGAAAAPGGKETQ
jgi:hypothetical protein